MPLATPRSKRIASWMFVAIARELRKDVKLAGSCKEKTRWVSDHVNWTVRQLIACARVYRAGDSATCQAPSCRKLSEDRGQRWRQPLQQRHVLAERLFAAIARNCSRRSGDSAPCTAATQIWLSEITTELGRISDRFRKSVDENCGDNSTCDACLNFSEAYAAETLSARGYNPAQKEASKGIMPPT